MSVAPANAVTFSGASEFISGTGDVIESDALGTVTFDWEDTPFSASIEFTVASSFNLFLTSYAQVDPDPGTSDVSGFTLDLLGGPPTRLTHDTDFCTGAAGAVAGDCDLVTDPANSGGNADSAAKPSLALSLLGLLAPGTYRIGFFDSATPKDASATFAVVPVPLPAAFPLFAGALGLMGFLGWRRKRVAAA